MKRPGFLKILFGLSFFYFSPFASADSNNHGDQPLTEVACRYEIRVTPRLKSKAPVTSNVWFFWRKPGMIQTQDADGDYGEIWEQTSLGVIQYRKLYHADKTAVEYMPADMPTNNVAFDWFRLASMLSEEALDALKLVKKTQVFGRSAELREGNMDGQRVEVLWLPNERLPAKILRKDKTGSVELRLAEISSLSEARRQPADPEDIANYRHIDAADFGDMENDPFVKKVMVAEGHLH